MGVGIRKPGMGMIRFLHSHHFEFPAFLQRLLCALKESPMAVLVSVVFWCLVLQIYANAVKQIGDNNISFFPVRYYHG